MSRGIKGLRGYANGGDPSPGVSRSGMMPFRLPMNIRQLAADVTGRQVGERLGWIPGMEKLGELIGSREINEFDLKPSEMRALQDAVIKGGGGRGGGSVLEYADYATGDNKNYDVGGGAGVRELLGKLFDPSYSMKTTFGQARVVKGDPARGENPEHYYVDDQYNFNRAAPDQLPWGESYDIVKDYISETGAYGLPRGIGKAFGSPEGEGSMARVDIGDLQEALARSRGEERPGLLARGIEGLRNMFARDRDREFVERRDETLDTPLGVQGIVPQRQKFATPGAFAAPELNIQR